jgi:hypothetical protein
LTQHFKREDQLLTSYSVRYLGICCAVRDS